MTNNEALADKLWLFFQIVDPEDDENRQVVGEEDGYDVKGDSDTISRVVKDLSNHVGEVEAESYCVCDDHK